MSRKRGPERDVVGVGGPCAKMMETEEDLDHLKGIQRYCEKKGPAESNSTVQEPTKRPEVWPTDLTTRGSRVTLERRQVTGNRGRRQPELR